MNGLEHWTEGINWNLVSAGVNCNIVSSGVNCNIVSAGVNWNTVTAGVDWNTVSAGLNETVSEGIKMNIVPFVIIYFAFAVLEI